MNEKFDKYDEVVKMIDEDEETEEKRKLQEQLEKSQYRAMMRAVIVVIDLSKTIELKDFKPSRFSVVCKMIKLFMKLLKEKNPLVQFSLMVGQQQKCKIRVPFTYDRSKVTQSLDNLKVLQKPGKFSIEACLNQCMSQFEKIPNYYRKEVLLIQTSVSTRDHKNVFQDIQFLKDSLIRLNIVSLVGEIALYKKIVSVCESIYITVSSEKQFGDVVNTIVEEGNGPTIPEVQKLVKFTFFKIEYQKEKVLCCCHFNQTNHFCVCGNCGGVICIPKETPVVCPVCRFVLILPTDIKMIEQKERSLI